MDGCRCRCKVATRDIPVLITPGHCPYPSWQVALQLAGRPGGLSHCRTEWSKLGSGPTENARACADVSKREIAMGDAAWDRIHRRDVTGVGDTGFIAGHAISGWCLVPIVTYSPD